jgi:flagellin-like protein
MGNMKANRKFVNEEEGVSAVIGVILMVAITVAIAATVYVYVSGMLGGSQNKAPNMAWNKETSPTKQIVLVSADSGLLWSQFTIGGDASTNHFAGTAVTAGDYITLDGSTGTISIIHTPTNTLMGTWTWS